MRTYRRISGALGELLWLELVFLMDWWARVKVFITPPCHVLLLIFTSLLDFSVSFICANVLESGHSPIPGIILEDVAFILDGYYFLICIK